MLYKHDIEDRFDTNYWKNLKVQLVYKNTMNV